MVTDDTIAIYLAKIKDDQLMRKLGAQFKALKHLKIQSQHVTDSMLESCVDFKLETLDLSGCFLLGDAGMQHVAAIQTLQKLDLSMDAYVSSEGVQTVANLPKLTYLNLFGCYHVEDRGLIALANRQTLQWLDVTSCEEITDQGVVAISKLPLRELTLPGFAAITDVALEALGRNARHLKRISMRKAPITDRGLLQLAKIATLEVLSVSQCDHISAQGVSAFKRLCPSCEVAADV